MNELTKEERDDLVHYFVAGCTCIALATLAVWIVMALDIDVRLNWTDIAGWFR